MKLKNLDTKTKLALGFSFIVLLTVAIVVISIISLNVIEKKNKNYEIVINAQKDFLIANSYVESYLNRKDSYDYIKYNIFLEDAFQSFLILVPHLNKDELVLTNDLIYKLKSYKELMLQNHESILKQKEIAGDRRKMRIAFTEEAKKYQISRNHDINYYFNQARLNAVYLLSSTDSNHFKKTEENIRIAINKANEIHCDPIIKALEDYMISVKENYDLDLKIIRTKEAQLALGKDILGTFGRITNSINSYVENVRRSTKVFMLFFSIIFIVISIFASRLIFVYMTNKQKIIEQKNKKLMDQADSLAAINALMEERQKQIEEQSEELLTQRDQLSELNATKDKLFSILAHDLKNPFNTILGFSDLLLTNIKTYSIDKIESQLTLIRDSTKFTYNLLENLLQWSRSQRGVISFEPEILKISEHVSQELRNLKQQALRKEITIDVFLIGDEKIVEADPNMIGTVIRNLISNAIKFSNKGSNIDIKLNFEQDHFRFSVKDYGIGMNEEKRNKLFKVNENISSRGTDGERGTGLGLLLCADFIEKHSGTIGIESELGKGSTFHFSLPYEQTK